MNHNQNNPNRGSFRVEDDIIMRMYVAQEDEKHLSRTDMLRKLHTDAELKKLHLTEEFHKLSDKFAQLANKKTAQPFLEAIQVINDKIDTLSAAILIEDAPKFDRVNISAGGIGVQQTEKLEPNTTVYIKLTFPPKYQSIICRACVTNVLHRPEKNPEKPFILGLKYENLSDSDERFLNRHILELQVASRQKE